MTLTTRMTMSTMTITIYKRNNKVNADSANYIGTINIRNHQSHGRNHDDITQTPT